MMRRLVLIGLVLAVAACMAPEPPGRKYVLFFQDWSAQLDDAGRSTIDQAAAQAKSLPSATVLVAGFADPVGTPQANIDMSRLRAQVVTDALVGAGLPRDRIQLRARGSVGFVDASLESRRVEVSVGKPQ
jgi:outer membrane protein OmpA-like peptidoglycan-associated protein